MTADAPDLTTLALRLEMIVDRLDKLEVQVRGLVTSQTVEAKEFVVNDDRGHVRARFEMKERLKIGLRTDSSPVVQVEQREIPLTKE
jgi:hypothetical protein